MDYYIIDLIALAWNGANSTSKGELNNVLLKRFNQNRGQLLRRRKTIQRVR